MASTSRQHHYLAPSDAAEEPPSWDELKRRRRLRVRIATIVVAIVVVGAGVAAMMANAAAHYAQGRQDMAAHHFGAAVEEFAAARILTFAYRDAQTLGERAQQELELDAVRIDLRRQQRAEVARTLRDATHKLVARDLGGVKAALTEARILVPEGPLASTPGQMATAARLVSSLSETGDQALLGGHWKLAAGCGAALLILDPAGKAGHHLSDRSRKAMALQKELDSARNAARPGHWRDALRLARLVLDKWPDFPGAAAVVTAARRALAPKPKPSPTAAPRATPTPAATVAPPPASTPAPPPPP